MIVWGIALPEGCQHHTHTWYAHHHTSIATRASTAQHPNLTTCRRVHCFRDKNLVRRRCCFPTKGGGPLWIGLRRFRTEGGKARVLVPYRGSRARGGMVVNRYSMVFLWQEIMVLAGWEAGLLRPYCLVKVAKRVLANKGYSVPRLECRSFCWFWEWVYVTFFVCITFCTVTYMRFATVVLFCVQNAMHCDIHVSWNKIGSFLWQHCFMTSSAPSFLYMWWDSSVEVCMPLGIHQCTQLLISVSIAD
jgi:hypothetical protein